MPSIEDALCAIASLEPDKTPNIASFAKAYGCSRTTLSRRYRGIQGSATTYHQSGQLLNPQQEKTLVKYIDGLCARHLTPTRQMIRNFAEETCGRRPGKDWVQRFLIRHPDTLVSKWTLGLDHNRARADSAFKYALYFELLKQKIDQHKVEPRHTYNMDEKGFLLGVLSKPKRVFSRPRYEEGSIKQVVQDGNREWITTIAAICADGTALSPSLIYQATTGLIQDSWLQNFDPSKHYCFFASSPSGWTNDILGLEWLTKVFDRETKEKARRAWRLLILDGHGSHINMRFIEYCDRNRILLAVYPPHSTHTLQPLDVSLFRPLSQAYSIELANFMDDCQGFTSLSKRDFFRLFWRAWNTSFTTKNILSGFECTGLYPFNPERVICKFARKDIERPSSSSSTNTVISSRDWAKIEKLLRSVVSDIYDKKAQRLSNTMHALSMENLLLQMQNKNLKKSLVNEKGRRRRGKPLMLDFPTENEGGAIFYSPNKVQQARDRQQTKDISAEAQRQQRAEEKVRREATKADKERLVEERKATRSLAREKRLQDLEAKRQKKIDDAMAKQANQQLQSELGIQANHDEQHIQPRQRQEKEQIEPAAVVEGGGVDLPAHTRSRQIRLPQRFQPIKRA